MSDEEKEEVRPLLSSSNKTILDQFIINTLQHLNLITHISTSTILIVLALTFIDQCIDSSIPLWTFFLIFFTGHAVLFVVMFNCIRCIYRTLQSESQLESKNGIGNWYIRNKEMIPLIQYLLFNLVSIFWISSIALIFEVLVFLSLLKIIPAYSFLVLIYIVTGLSLSNAIVCRSSSFFSSLSSLLLLVTAILLHLKVHFFSKISYSLVFIPSYVFLAYWFFICIYILVCDFLQIYRLKNIQYQILTIFATSFIVLLVADIGLMEYLDDPNAAGKCGGPIVISCFFLVGFLFFSFALIFNVSNGIDVNVIRMSGEEPKNDNTNILDSLIVVDEYSDKIYGIYLLVGDIKLANPKIKPVNNDTKTTNWIESFVDLIICFMLDNIQNSPTSLTNSENPSSFSRPSLGNDKYSRLQGIQSLELDDNDSTEQLL